MEEIRQPKNPKIPSRSRMLILLSVAAPFLLLAVMWVLTTLTNRGSVVIGLDEEKISAAGTELAVAVYYGDILSVDSIGVFDTGECLSGKTTSNTIEGIFSTDAFGECTILAYHGGGRYLRIVHWDGTLILAGPSADTTDYYYEELLSRLQ